MYWKPQAGKIKGALLGLFLTNW